MSRTRSYHPWLWSVVALALCAAPSAAQPPSPVELARGLRENGQFDLALQYIKELEGQPLSPEDKATLALERAKCLLEASEDEIDAGTREGMISEAKEGLEVFLRAPNHPRRVEGLLAQAKLTALDAREQLNRARKIDIPIAETDAEKPAQEAAEERQKAEAQKAVPMFLLAAKRYKEASELLRAKLDDPALTPATRKALEREAFEADLASGITQFNTAEAYIPQHRLDSKDKDARNAFLEAAKETFGKFEKADKTDKGVSTNRTVWMARAWIAEVTYEQDDFNTAAQKVAEILKAPVVEADEGKRLARFFALRRNYLLAMKPGTPLAQVNASETELRGWLLQYRTRKVPEVFAVKFYLARVFERQAYIAWQIKDPAKPPALTATARGKFEAAEREYRELAQTDHDYTARANRNRMQVVRRLLGAADQSPAAYTTFERAQMASLIQMSNMFAEEAKKEPDPAKIEAARAATIALLERARELATPADNQADVVNALLQLIYFYHLADQPYNAAVLGEHVARTIKSTGGKAAHAGLLGVNGYISASARMRADPTASEKELADRAAARATDRRRAEALARFLDQRYPNDQATDAARYRLASLLTDDKRPLEAFEVLTRVRPAYAGITSVRLLEGFLAAQIIGLKDVDPAKKLEVYKRAVTDLAKTPRPVTVAPKEEVRGYLSARCRLASLMFSQARVDPKAEETAPGHNLAMDIAKEVFDLIPTFDNLFVVEGEKKDGPKKLNLDGIEMTILAQDVRARALYLRGRALIDAGNLDEAAKWLDPAIAEIEKGGSAITAEMKGWGASGDEADAAHKARILDLAGRVDKTRVEVLLAGFRLRTRQGKLPDANAILDTVIRVGGTLEENLPVLEALGRETAGKMIVLKKEGKVKEATELGAGLAILLKKIIDAPKLSTQQLLFVGQMLVAVGEHDKAIETLRKVPEPEFKEWRTAAPDRWPGQLAELKKKMEAIENALIKTLPPEDQQRAADEAERADVVAQKVVPALKNKDKDDYTALQQERAELDKKIKALPMGLLQRYPSQIRDYAVAQLNIARALRESKRFSDAEKMLQEILGAPDKPGWGSGRLYFRKELALVYEDRGASAADVKAANGEWGKALREWTTLFNIQRARASKLPPPAKPLDATATDEQKQEWEEKEKRRQVEAAQVRNDFADAYFETQRCLIKANQQLVKDPARLTKTMDDVAKHCVDMEKQLKPEEWDPEVRNRYADLLRETPALMASYKNQGGKLFLEKVAPATP